MLSKAWDQTIKGRHAFGCGAKLGVIQQTSRMGCRQDFGVVAVVVIIVEEDESIKLDEIT